VLEVNPRCTASMELIEEGVDYIRVGFVWKTPPAH
jgi:hypothetical protein